MILALLIWPGAVCTYASGCSNVMAFGDKISDTGDDQRFSDGGLWAESPAADFLANLHDLSSSGAAPSQAKPANLSPLRGLLWQIQPSAPFITPLPSAGTLLTVWAGSNDLLLERPRKEAAGDSGATRKGLYAAGGRYFLVPNLPNRGNTPFFAAIPDLSAPQNATLWRGFFNTSLETMLEGFDGMHADINLYFIDIFSIFEQYAVGSRDWQDLFWTDGFHPSAVGHDVIHQAAAAHPVPEPGSSLLLASGMAGIAWFKRRKTTTR